MKAFPFLVVVITVAGCGPLSVPMATRPNAERQEKIDRAWDRALSPVSKLTRQEWLDLFVGAQAYQYGVDKLHLRSEKAFSDGRVVMEVSYDRARPQADRFEVRVYNDKGKLLREEKFTRQDVKSTVSDLFPPKTRPADEKERVEFEKQHKARWEKIQSYFPDAGKDTKTGK